MKHNLFILIFAVLLFNIPQDLFAFPNDLFEQKESKTVFIGKLGTSYIHDMDTFGLDLSLNYVYKLDPFFHVGAESGFFWNQWEQKLGRKDETPPRDVIADTNVFMVPMFLNAQIRVPYLDKKHNIEPYITVGLGWSFAYVNYTRPEYTAEGGSPTYSEKKMDDFYNGFAWQLIATVAVSPSKESKVKFLVDVGFRGTSPENSDNEKIRMSGLLLRFGVVVPL